MNNWSSWIARFTVIAAATALYFSGCAAGLKSKPGVYEVSHEKLERPDRTLDITYVKPAKPRSPLTLVVFATGDAAWFGASGTVFEHMAEQGYYAAGLDSKKAVAPNRKTGERVSIADTATALEATFAHAKRTLGLPESTPVIVTGMSRGAGMVVFSAAEPTIRKGVLGAVAIALTKESDYLRAADPATRHPGVQVDEKERILFYPLLKLLAPLPVAVLQSTSDRYISSDESRRLMGPDTPSLRLYEVKARNHGFGGGTEELLRDLDDALKWIEASAAK